MWQHLADELLAEILTRLPVKCIIQCRYVCKSWRSLISSPYFIASHHRKSNNNNTQIFVLQQKPFLHSENNLLHFDDSHQNRHFRSMLARLSTQSNCALEFVGCANGLICFGLRSGEFYKEFIVFNPEIGCFVSVVVRHYLFAHSGVKGFGFDDTTLDYKIFLAYPFSCFYLYSLNSGSWSVTPCPHNWSRNRDNYVVFVNGRFHWVVHERYGHKSPYIMVFDLKREAFDQPISIPFSEGVLHEFKIVQYGKSSSIGVIQMIKKNLIHVWAIEVLGQNESSCKKLASKVWIGNRRNSRIEAQEVVGFKNEEELVIRFFNGRLVSLNIKDKTVCDLLDTKTDGYMCKFSVHTHVPNLILLDEKDV